MSKHLSLISEHNASNVASSRSLGERGEELAREVLIQSGYRIVCTNFKVPVGRNRRGAVINGEIDIIAFDEDVLCFIEVKTRRSDSLAAPESNVDLRKQRQIIRAAKMYRKIFHSSSTSFRYDVASIVLNDRTAPKIELLKNFFREEKFRKNYWSKDEYR